MAWLYVSQEEFQYLTISSFFFHVISIIFLFVFVKTTDDVVYYMLFGIIIAVGPNIYNLFNIKKKINLFQKCTLEIKKHIKPTSVFFAMSVAASIYIMLDTVMLGFLTNDAEVGYYTAATKINKMVAGIFAAVTGVLLPRLTYYVEKKENERIQSLVEKSFSITILLVLPATAGLFLLANPLVLLFSGANYAPAIVPMKIMTPVIIMIAIASFTGTQLLPALGKEKISLYSYIIGATVNSTFNFIFIPKLGAAGAGIATVIAESLVTFTQTIYCFKMFNSKSLVHTILRNMAHAIIGTVIMSLCVLCILFFTTNTILQIALSIITGITVYAIFLHLIQNMFFRNICSAIKQKLPK
ncbi:MAG: polysaccharide biosynthesis C-terminal domain-containing protein [Treponema sp.]|nr:polysaccharide biosynthesis C-terminal domain-containing protein [Treponema sp.]